MQTKFLLKLLGFIILMTACAPKLADSSISTPYSTSSPAQTNFISQITLTPTLGVTKTIEPSPSVTPISTPIDWNNLSKLSELILLEKDIEPTYLALSQITNLTNELGTSCLLDCAKTSYSTREGFLIITLLRAENNQEAANVAQGLKKQFLDASGDEFKSDELQGLPPEQWIIIHKSSSNKYRINATTGISYGRIVVLVSFGQNLCFDTDEGFKCEGDLYALVRASLFYSYAQIDKLKQAGYPK